MIHGSDVMNMECANWLRRVSLQLTQTVDVLGQLSCAFVLGLRLRLNIIPYDESAKTTPYTQYRKHIRE